MITLLFGLGFILLGVIPCGGLTFWLLKEFNELEPDRGEQKI